MQHQSRDLRAALHELRLTKGMNPDERALMALPVHFNAGRGSVMSILYLGGTIFIQEKFDADAVFGNNRARKNHLHDAGANALRAPTAPRAFG